MVSEGKLWVNFLKTFQILSTSYASSGCVTALTFLWGSVKGKNTNVFNLEGSPIIHPVLSQGDSNQAVTGITFKKRIYFLLQTDSLLHELKRILLSLVHYVLHVWNHKTCFPY